MSKNHTIVLDYYSDDLDIEKCLSEYAEQNPNVEYVNLKIVDHNNELLNHFALTIVNDDILIIGFNDEHVALSGLNKTVKFLYSMRNKHYCIYINNMDLDATENHVLFEDFSLDDYR
ncbi:hypothetical protein DS891_07095 [Pseudoalteromonas sp. JC28]|uniref:hypothetical protein n=1 Tax=Pseudoalteromonas sp. JC28 TaxID=2267617 RepID=UPI001573C9AA|nr:hypothetical protein [Pseudoalteromonas sp. JC28]NSY33364.1 hypothetical protein [Pseudoalteromonas sp. JC28]